MNWTAYEVTLKNTPRSHRVHSWIRFGESAEHVTEQLHRDTRGDLPELVILTVEPVADPRGQKVRELAEAAEQFTPRFSASYDPARARARHVKPTRSLTGHSPDAEAAPRFAGKCDPYFTRHETKRDKS